MWPERGTHLGLFQEFGWFSPKLIARRFKRLPCRLVCLGVIETVCDRTSLGRKNVNLELRFLKRYSPRLDRPHPVGKCFPKLNGTIRYRIPQQRTFRLNRRLRIAVGLDSYIFKNFHADDSARLGYKELTQTLSDLQRVT